MHPQPSLPSTPATPGLGPLRPVNNSYNCGSRGALTILNSVFEYRKMLPNLDVGSSTRGPSDEGTPFKEFIPKTRLIFGRPRFGPDRRGDQLKMRTLAKGKGLRFRFCPSQLQSSAKAAGDLDVTTTAATATKRSTAPHCTPNITARTSRSQRRVFQ